MMPHIRTPSCNLLSLRPVSGIATVRGPQAAQERVRNTK